MPSLGHKIKRSPDMAYEDVILASNPDHYWPMKDTSGTTCTALVGIDCVYDTVTLDQTGLRKGGKSVLINGGRVYNTTSSVGNYTGDDYTIECWLKINSSQPDNAPVIFYKGDYAVNGYFHQFGYGAFPISAIFRSFQSGLPTECDFSPGLTHSTIYHLVFVKKGINGFIYVNGVQRTNYFGTLNNAASSTDNFTIANYVPNLSSNYLYANISDVALYGRALPVEEVIQHYRAGGGIPTLSYENVIAESSPTNYWSCKETSGTNMEANVGTVNGTYGSGVTLSPTPLRKNGRSFHCDATANGKSTLSDNSAGNYMTGDFSIEFWFRRQTGSPDNAPCLMHKYGATQDRGYYIGLEYGATTNIYFVSFQSGGVNQQVYFDDGGSPLVLSIDVLYHIVITRTGTTMKCYVNSTSYNRWTGTTLVSPDSSTTDPLIIGADETHGNYFYGWISDVALYDRVLTQTEVTKHYAKGVL